MANQPVTTATASEFGEEYQNSWADAENEGLDVAVHSQAEEMTELADRKRFGH